MAGEAELMPVRNLSYVLGVNESGLIGRKSIYPRNNRVAMIGDSIAYNNIWPSALETAANVQCRYMAHGAMTWAMYLSRQRFTFERAHAFGIPGNDTFDLIGGGPNNVPDRLSTALLASDAATWVVNIATNDLTANYDETTSIANLTTIINRILDADRAVVVIVPMPRDGGASGTLTATQRLRLAAIRKWLLAQRQTDRFFVVDPWEYMADRASTTGAPKAGMTYDGLHPAQIGAYWCGYALARFFGLGRERGYFAYVDVMNRSNMDAYNAADNPGGCLSPNPQMIGTAGTPGTGGSGTLADGWVGQLGGSAGVTRTYSKVMCADGEPAQQIVLGGTAASDGDHWLLIKNPVDATQLAIGDVIEGYADVEVDAGTVGVPGFGVGIAVNTGLLRVMWGDYTTATKATNMPAVAHSGVMKTPRLTLADTSIRFGFYAFTANGASPALTARIRGIELRKVLPA